MRNTDPQFYATIGPFLSRREIVKELGFPIWDDDDKTWIVSVDNGIMMAFCGVIVNRAVAQITSFYTAPKYRGGGLGSMLLQEALDYARVSGCTVAKATATPEGRRLFEKAGFYVAGYTGRYSKMEQVLS